MYVERLRIISNFRPHKRFIGHITFSKIAAFIAQGYLEYCNVNRITDNAITSEFLIFPVSKIPGALAAINQIIARTLSRPSEASHLNTESGHIQRGCSSRKNTTFGNENPADHKARVVRPVQHNNART